MDVVILSLSIAVLKEAGEGSRDEAKAGQLSIGLEHARKAGSVGGRIAELRDGTWAVRNA